MWYRINDRELTIDKVFFEVSYPILFTCQDQNGRVYFCVCCQNNEIGRRWLIAEVLPEHIISLLENKITTRDLLIHHKHWCVFDDGAGMRQDDSENIWDEDSKYLPKQDSFLEPDDGEYDEEIEYYKTLPL